MENGIDILFSKLQLGRTTLRNRIVAPPMVQVRDIASPEGQAWYRRLAQGGAGLVIIEATGVNRFGTNLTLATLEPLVKAIHQGGAAAAIQLFPVEFGTPADVNLTSLEETRVIPHRFAQAAVLCKEAGFDAVEIHGAHGYLIHQFFMPDLNKRHDCYGQTLDNRCRLAVQIVSAIKQAVGDELAILYRHTPVGKAYWIDDSLTLAQQLIEAGVNGLDISPARDKMVGDLAAPFKARFPAVPIIAVKGMEDPLSAAQALRDQRCDLVAIGRGLICDAQWPLKVQQSRMGDIRTCIQCEQGCFGNLRKRTPVYCTQWTQDEVSLFLN